MLWGQPSTLIDIQRHAFHPKPRQRCVLMTDNTSLFGSRPGADAVGVHLQSKTTLPSCKKPSAAPISASLRPLSGESRFFAFGAGKTRCWVMDLITWQVMVGFVDDTKWPTRTVRPAMECINEITEFMVSRPGPNIRPLQITPAHGRHVSGVLSELAFVLSEFAFVERWGRHAGDRCGRNQGRY